MSNIKQELNKIINAVYGKDVRQAIHDAIKKSYDDAAKGGDSNAEITLARGESPTLGDRLDNMQLIDGVLFSLLEQKIAKGEASLDDFDEETRGMILNLNPGDINAVLGDRNVQRINIAIGAVSPKETNFLIKNIENIFDGEYIDAVYTWDSGAEGRSGFFIASNGYFGHDGRLIIFPVEPNETYSINIDGPHDMFRLGIHNSTPEIPDVIADEGIINKENKFYTTTDVVDEFHGNKFTFKNTEGGRYGILYVSKSGQKPSLYINKENSYSLDSEYLDFKEITKKVKNNTPERHSTAIEDAEMGYPPRPRSTSVTWIGPSEPSEAEPYDEWRETKGFTYFTDFSEYELDQPPHDWSERFSTTTVENRVISSRNYGGNVYWLRLETDNAPYADAFDEVVGEHLDTEVFMKVRYDEFVTGQPLTAVHRGKMNSYGKEVYLIAGMLNVGPAKPYFRAALKTENDDVAAHLARIPLKEGFDPTEQYCQVSRVDGNRFRGKYWQIGEPEPNEWDFDVQVPIENHMDPGFVGVYAYKATTNYYIYEFGVGTGGMRAPRRKVL